MDKVIVLNNKMNLLYDDVYEYIERLNKYDKRLIICPSDIYLSLFLVNSNHEIGSQNVFYENSGAYTGEISPLQLKNMDINYSIIGHSERKKMGETDNIINKKIISCLDNNIIPIVCIGEENKNNFKEEIDKQLKNYLKKIDNIDFIYFAYEPVWLIGSSTVETNQIKDNIDYLVNYFKEKYNKIPCLLYGGGVNSDNINDIINIDNIEGVVLGEISSNINKLESIIDVLEK